MDGLISGGLKTGGGGGGGGLKLGFYGMPSLATHSCMFD